MTVNKKPIAAAIGAMLLLGAMASPALARWGDRDDHRGRRDWDGGYYRRPPVVYNNGYGYGHGYGYYPPPVVYGPSVGVYLPGVNLNIR